ncbi:MAG: DUF4012 domain-containing protein [Chloroflexota bacterium]
MAKKDPAKSSGKQKKKPSTKLGQARQPEVEISIAPAGVWTLLSSPKSVMQKVIGAPFWSIFFRRLRQTVGICLLLLLLWVGYKGVRLGYYGWQSYQNAQFLLTFADDIPDLQEIDAQTLTQLQETFAGLSQALSGIDKEAKVFMPLVQRNALWFGPEYEQTLEASPQLLTFAQAMTALTAEGLAVIGPAWQEESNSSAPEDSLKDIISRVVPLVASSSHEFQSMAGHAATATEAIDSIGNIHHLHPRLASLLTQAKPLLPLMEPMLEVAPRVPSAVGFDGPKTYLLLMQNNHELRGTGGFLTAVGQVVLDAGQLSSLDFHDSYDIQREEGEYPWAPIPMRDYMGIELMLFRDANWSPDLPTTAQVVRSLYQQDTGVVVDGIVTIDLHAVENLITAIEPLTLKGTDQPLTGSNIVDQVKEFWNRPLETEETRDNVDFWRWWEQRKDFIPALADAGIERLQSGDVDYEKAVQAALDSLDQRSIQIWLADQEVSAVLATLGWDGGLQPQPEIDFVGLVDTNLGFNKVDSVVKRRLEYQVGWLNQSESSKQPVGIATATIHYQHPLDLPNHECDITPRYGADYDDMARRCYFNYVRLYVPVGSTLEGWQGVEDESVSSSRGESGLALFSGYFKMLPGKEHSVTFHYRLPEYITPNNYKLVMQRQSGTNPLPFRVQAGQDVFEGTLTTNTKVFEFREP